MHEADFVIGGLLFFGCGSRWRLDVDELVRSLSLYALLLFHDRSHRFCALLLLRSLRLLGELDGLLELQANRIGLAEVGVVLLLDAVADVAVLDLCHWP